MGKFRISANFYQVGIWLYFLVHDSDTKFVSFIRSHGDVASLCLLGNDSDIKFVCSISSHGDVISLCLLGHDNDIKFALFGSSHGDVTSLCILGQDNDPDSKVHGANMGPTWALSAPIGPHVGPMNLANGGYQLRIVCKFPRRYTIIDASSSWLQYQIFIDYKFHGDATALCLLGIDFVIKFELRISSHGAVPWNVTRCCHFCHFWCR